jgi:hypothetical protein
LNQVKIRFYAQMQSKPYFYLIYQQNNLSRERAMNDDNKPYFPVGARLCFAPSILTGSTCRDNCDKVEPCRNKVFTESNLLFMIFLSCYISDYFPDRHVPADMDTQNVNATPSGEKTVFNQGNMLSKCVNNSARLLFL